MAAAMHAGDAFEQKQGKISDMIAKLAACVSSNNHPSHYGNNDGSISAQFHERTRGTTSLFDFMYNIFLTAKTSENELKEAKRVSALSR